jgi:hypothetical protein
VFEPDGALWVKMADAEKNPNGGVSEAHSVEALQEVSEGDTAATATLPTVTSASERLEPPSPTN